MTAFGSRSAARRVWVALLWRVSDAINRAVRDVLAHGLRGDLAHSVVGVELLATLPSSDIAPVERELPAAPPRRATRRRR